MSIFDIGPVSMVKALLGTDQVGKLLTKEKNDANSKSTTVVLLAQNNKQIEFNVSEGGGNKSFSNNSENPKVALAKLIFGDNPRAVALLEQLTDKLAAAGVKSADINVDSAGKLDITNISTKERLPNEKPEKDGPSLAKFLAINYGGANNKILMEIFNIALEARSDVIKMIIEAMEQNHQMWMAMLKELAIKINEKKLEEKGLLKSLMAKIASGDEAGAKGIVALLAELGFQVTLAQQDSTEKSIGKMKDNIYKDINLALSEKSNIARVLSEYRPQLAMLGLGKEDIANLKEAVVNNDVAKARKVFDSTGNLEIFDNGMSDSIARRNIGLA